MLKKTIFSIDENNFDTNQKSNQLLVKNLKEKNSNLISSIRNLEEKYKKLKLKHSSNNTDENNDEEKMPFWKMNNIIKMKDMLEDKDKIIKELKLELKASQAQQNNFFKEEKYLYNSKYRKNNLGKGFLNITQ